MSIQIKRLDRVSVLDFASVHELTLVVEELPPKVAGSKPFIAKFKDTEFNAGDCWWHLYAGRGATTRDAIEDYLLLISGYKLRRKKPHLETTVPILTCPGLLEG